MIVRLPTIKGQCKVCTFNVLVGLQGVRNPVGTWFDHNFPQAVQQISFLIRFLIVPVERWSTPLQWLCRVCWLLEENEICCRIYADLAHHAITGRFSAPRNCVQILAQANHSPRFLQAALYGQNRDWSVNRTLSKVPDAIRYERLPAQVVCNPDEVDEYAVELLWDGFWQIAQKSFGYAFYCEQPEAHLCNTSCCLINILVCAPVRWMDYLNKEVLTYTDLWEIYVSSSWTAALLWGLGFVRSKEQFCILYCWKALHYGKQALGKAKGNSCAQGCLWHSNWCNKTSTLGPAIELYHTGKHMLNGLSPK